MVALGEGVVSSMISHRPLNSRARVAVMDQWR
jgi:hypothetical protein